MMQRLMTIVALAACAVLAAPVQAQVYPERIPTLARERDRSRLAWSQRNEREEQTDRVTKTVRLGPSGQIDLGNISGDIVVTRAGGADATIEVVKTARGRTADDARELLQLVTAEIV